MEAGSSVGYFLLTGFVHETGWLFDVENSRVYHCVWLKESPDQIVRDLAIFEKRCKTGFDRCVCSTHVSHQQIEVLELRIMVGMVLKFCSIGFKFGDVVIQQVLLKLFSSLEFVLIR